MPNNTTNELIIEGSLESRELLLKTIRGENIDGENKPFTFHKIIPMPEYISKDNVNTKDINKENNWYNWCPKNWGTKWDAYDVEINENGSRQTTIRFYTAWSPPAPIIEKLSQLFPHLKITHYFIDEGCGYAGYDVYEMGNRTEEIYYEEKCDGFIEIAEYLWGNNPFEVAEEG